MAETRATEAAKPATARFLVSDMTCGHCVGTVRRALEEALPGASIDIDLASHLVTVSADAARAEAAIRDAGYTPRPAAG